MIRNIIFDLGNVLVDVEYERFRKKIESSGVSREAYDRFFMGGNYRLLGYESGEINTDEFITRCIAGLGLKMTRQEYADAFNDMFSEITQMSGLLKRLHREGRHSLFLLSNTSPLHFEYIKKKYEYINLLNDYALSYELRSLKPEDEIYERTIVKLGIIPGESVFIDDLPENCAAAEKFGIKAVHYSKNDHEAFMGNFKKIVNHH